MADRSSIEWTDATWSPVVGCTRVSTGCDHCYAVRQTRRLAAMGQVKYAGLVNDGKGHFNGTARLHKPSLAVPLRWRRGRRIFVNPMSDLFHEELAFEEIAAVFGVMAAAGQHTFQVLTKRPERAHAWFVWAVRHWPDLFPFGPPPTEPDSNIVLGHFPAHLDLNDYIPEDDFPPPWPLPNVWLGVSVEDQVAADVRIPLLLRCPAAVRFVSYEPALGAVDFRAFLERGGVPPHHEAVFGILSGPGQWLNWIIVGGESGPGARPFAVAWARSTIEQCAAAGVACFVKQLGARPYVDADGRWDGAGELVGNVLGRYYVAGLAHKGGDPAEWPEDLRLIRQFPEANHA